MKLYGLKNCDSCRKARKALETAGKTVEFIDVRQNPLDENKLGLFLQTFGEENLVNRKSTTWRQLGEAARQQPALELLKEHPALMKRPVLQSGDSIHLGWAKDVQAHFCV